MAVSSSDSLTKLPPINIKPVESLTEDKEERRSAENQTQSSHLRGLNRKRHGLVRLPPIVRLDSFPTAVNKSPCQETEEIPFLGRLEIQDDEYIEQTDIFSLDTQRKQPFAYSRFNNDSDAGEEDSSDVGEKDRNNVNKYTEVQASETNLNFTLGSRKKMPFPKLTIKNEKVPYDRLLNTPPERNRESDGVTHVEAVTSSRKVQRTNRFAKSIPIVKRTNTKVPGKESKSLTATHIRREKKYSTEKESKLEASVKKNSVFLNSESPNLTEQSHNATYLEKLSSNSLMKIDKDNAKQRKGKRILSDSKSTPASPLRNRGTSIDNRSGRPFNSAKELFVTPTNKRVSICPPSNQLVTTSNELCVEGRSFVPTERVNCRVNNLETESTRNSLNLPSFSEKRASVYDLQQILSLLNTEDNSNSFEDYNDRGPVSNARKSRASSTYDLKEFLLLRPPVKSPEISANSLKNSTSSLRTPNNYLSVETSTSVKESEDSRRPSAYDLLEFLQLSNPNLSQNVNQSSISKQKTLDHNETGRRTVPLLGGERNLELPGKNSSCESRRSSMYDLTEFLSLNYPIEKRNLESNCNNNRENISDKRRQEAMGKLHLPETREQKTIRSNSIYDLMEFLTMSSIGANSGTSQDGPERKKFSNGAKALPDYTSDKSGYSSEKKLQATKPQTSNQPHRNNKRQKTHANVTSNDDNKLDVSDIEEARKERAASLYDLKEFLVLNTTGTAQSKQATSQNNNNSSSKTNDNKSFLLTPEVVPEEAMAKRGSVYNLHEFLQVLQNEAETQKDNAQNLKTRSSSASPVETRNDRTDSRNSSGYSTATDSPTFVPRKATQEPPQIQRQPSTQVSPEDLLDVLKLAQSPQFALGRKSSGISVFSRASSLEGPDDVFLCVPGTARKRSSVYDLHEFLNLLNSDDAPLRRRLSSVLSKRQSEDNLPVTPEPLSRSDSGGVKSMCDLSEFLALLNKDESPLRRKLSSTSSSYEGSSSVEQTSLQHQDSGELTFYSLDEILTALNEMATKNSENAQDNLTKDEISIPVPSFNSHSKNLVREKKDTGTTIIQLKTRISGSSRALNSVPEYHEVKASDGKRSSI